METASRKVITEILKKIEKKELKIGDKIPSERELSNTLGVSRSSVREALSAMNMMGMTEVHPKGRTTLKPFHLAEFINTLSGLLFMEEDMDRQIREYRMTIEMESVRLAALRDDGKEIRKILERMKRCRNQKQADKLDLEFHLAIARASKNTLLEQSSQATLSLIERSVIKNRTILKKKYPDLKELIQEHEDILNAIEAHNTEKAQELLYKHLAIEE